MAATTDTKDYKLNHTMLRVKDPKKTLEFYSFLGMSLVGKLSYPQAKFDLYFLAYDKPGAVSAGNNYTDRQGVIELTHNYGSENDDSFKANNGNEEPHRGFGHVCVSVDNIQAACARIEAQGYSFRKKLTDGRMKHIAFVLDPDGYWVEIVPQKQLHETEGITETDVSTYRMNHTMIRVKDKDKSIAWYTDVLGMTLLKTIDASDFTIYFLGFVEEDFDPENPRIAFREGLLELTWNHGTEKDEGFKYHSGNDEPKGFGHIAITVDNLEAACKRFDDHGCSYRKRLTDGSMKNIAFLLDPDGYWVEVLQNERISGKPNFPDSMVQV